MSRSTPEAKLKEIEKYKRIAELRTNVPNNLSKGRALFNQVCVQCHKLYGEGGSIGPDITGSDRRNLHYIISNIVDPNAEIPNDYRTTIVRMKDDRVLVGVIRSREGQTITVATPGEVLSVAKRDVAAIEPQNFSMMPEGLVLTFSDQELRDLISYLRAEGQVPLPGGKAALSDRASFHEKTGRNLGGTDAVCANPASVFLRVGDRLRGDHRIDL